MLELRDVTMRFGGLTAVNEFNMHVDEGEIVGLIGPNGAGKTTAFNVINRVYPPTGGAVYFKDERIDTCKRYEIAGKGISRTYQNINLFRNLTALDNVKIGCHCRTQEKAGLLASLLRLKSERSVEKVITEKSMELLEYMGIARHSAAVSASLSYGDQRRLEICRALASDPELLLLDEPAAGMNMTEKEQLRQMIGKIRERGVTILLVEHDMRLVMGITDRIYVLDHGVKIAEGTPDEVKSNPLVIEAYLGGGTK